MDYRTCETAATGLVEQSNWKRKSLVRKCETTHFEVSPEWRQIWRTDGVALTLSCRGIAYSILASPPVHVQLTQSLSVSQLSRSARQHGIYASSASSSLTRTSDLFSAVASPSSLPFDTDSSISVAFLLVARPIFPPVAPRLVVPDFLEAGDLVIGLSVATVLFDSDIFPFSQVRPRLPNSALNRSRLRGLVE